MTGHGVSANLNKYSKLPGIRRIRFSFIACAGLMATVVILILISTLPLSFEQQFVFAILSLALSELVRNHQKFWHVSRIILILISCVTTSRYIYWRLTETLGWPDPMGSYTILDCTFSISLLAAEYYAWISLFLGYFQTLWPLSRTSVSLPDDCKQWPSVDVFIPTYNEPLNVVIPSILAAKNMDWPSDRLNVYVLDDGCREEFKEFSEEAGVHYIERLDNTHAKAGNINHALGQSDGDYIAIFDSDHVPVKSFLTRTVGWFIKDDKLGLVQTPHVFFSPDPVERNLDVFHQIPNEGELFYGLIQDGNDTWNATFFCGSCAVLKRQALEAIGGVAVETVTEDAHTSLRMHRNGWHSAYLNEPLAAGLATERLSAHIGQRMRWSRGMVQIFRLDNPLLGKGLSWGQRLSYFNAMLHFLFSIPRLIFLLSPLAFLFFEAHIIQATALMIAVYALPHIIQSHVTSSSIQGRYRHAFWAEVYETLLSVHILRPTLMALISPYKGKFNVTNKGGVISESHFDRAIVRPVLLILALNITALIIGFLRLFWWNTHELDTVIINLLWTAYNIIILGAAVSVAWEKRQLRQNTRIPRQEKVAIQISKDKEISAISTSISLTDIGVQASCYTASSVGDSINIKLIDKQKKSLLIPGKIMSLQGNHIGVRFHKLNANQMSDLTYFTYMREDSWVKWYGSCLPRRTLYSFLEVTRHSLTGLCKSLFFQSKKTETRPPMNYATTCWVVVLIIVVLASQWMPGIAHAKTLPSNTNTLFSAESPIPENHDFTDSLPLERRLSLKQMGQHKPVQLHDNLEKNIGFFSIRRDEEVVSAELRLQLDLPQKLTNNFTRLDVMLNGQVFGSIDLNNPLPEKKQTAIFPIEPFLIGEDNNLSVRLVAINDSNCIDIGQHKKSALINSQSEVLLGTQHLPLVNDLSTLPVPFFDEKDQGSLILPFVLDHSQASSAPVLQAAGVLSSWFGAQADYRGAYFPVLINKAPENHAVVLITPESQLPWLNMPTILGPSIKLIPHPKDPYIKLLLIMGRNKHEILQAARGLALDKFNLAGEESVLNTKLHLPVRQAYDAPRWLPTDRKIRFSELTDSSKDALRLKQFPSDVIRVNFRMRPDIFAWDGTGIPLELIYFYNNLDLDHNSRLNIGLNNKSVGHVPLGQTDRIISRAFWEQQKIIVNNEPQDTLTDMESGTVDRSAQLNLPLNMIGGINHLDLHFDLQSVDILESTCMSVSDMDISGGLSSESSMDLRGFYHFSQLPDLAMFANAGFPFTRYADLSETAVVMPAQPYSEDIQAMLEVLGRFGMATGYPASKVKVVTPNNLNSVKNRDLLVIGSHNRQILYEHWKNKLPLQRTGSHWRQRELTPWQKLNRWWNNMSFQGNQQSSGDTHPVQIEKSDHAVIFGIQSPLSKGRSVVALWSGKPENLLAIGQALNTPERVKYIQGDFVTIASDKITGQRVSPHYYVGHLPHITFLRWYLSHNFLALITVFLSALFISALLVIILMRHRAAGRFIFRTRTS